MALGGWAAGSFVSLVATLIAAGRVAQLLNRRISALRFAVHLFENGQAQEGRLSWLLSVQGASRYVYYRDYLSADTRAFPTEEVESWVSPYCDPLTGAIVASELEAYLASLRAAPRRKLYAYRHRPTGVSSFEDQEAALDIYSEMIFT